MPNGPRIRANNVYGLISNDPLTAASSTFDSDSLPLLPVVQSAHAVIVFDPKRVHGDPEIVVVTVHTADSVTATILRGQYGTSPREHPQGTAWAHVPIDEDFIENVVSSDRPRDPYRGQIIFERDTNSFVARSTADAWENVLMLGAWVPWTPVYTNIAIGSGTTVARYTKIGRTVFYRIRFVLNGSTISANPTFTLPFPPNATTYAGQDASVGQTTFEDAGVITYRGSARWVGSGSAVWWIVYNASTANLHEVAVTGSVPITFGNGDALVAWGTYEAAN